MENETNEILNAKLNTAAIGLRGIVMTAAEKVRMREFILHSRPAAARPVESPYTFRSLMTILSVVCCLVLIVGSGAVFASGSSLPGSALYPLKVKVIEPLRGAFMFSPAAKTQYRAYLADERTREAAALSDKNKPDMPKENRGNRQEIILDNQATNSGDKKDVSHLKAKVDEPPHIENNIEDRTKITEEKKEKQVIPLQTDIKAGIQTEPTADLHL